MSATSRVVVLALSASLTVVSCSGAPAVAPKPFQRAIQADLEPERLRALVRRSWETPSKHYRRALREAIATAYPETPEGLFCRGWLTYDPNEEARLYRAALGADPSFAEAWSSLAHTLYFKLFRRAEAARVLAEGLTALAKHNPSDEGLLLAKRSEFHREVHRFADALKDARTAVKASPSRAAPRRALCEVYLADHLIDACLELWRKGLASAEDQARFHYELSEVLTWHRHDHHAGLQALRQAGAAARYDPGFFEGRIGTWYRKARAEPEEAVKRFDAAWRLTRNPRWLREKARALAETGNQKAALTAWAEASSSSTPDPAASYRTLDGAWAAVGWADALTADGQETSLDKAEAVLREAWAQSPGLANVVVQLAALVTRRDRAPEALEILKQGAAQQPWSWWVAVKLAAALAEQAPEDGVDYLESWLKTRPDCVFALDHLTYISIRVPALRAKTLAWVERGLRLDPDNKYMPIRLHDLPPDARREALMLLFELHRETNIDAYLLAAANYASDPLGDSELGVRLLMERAQAKRGEPSVEVLRRLAQDLFRQTSARWRKMAFSLYDQIATLRPDYLAARLQHLEDLLSQAQNKRVEALGERLEARFPDAPGLHQQMFGFQQGRDVDQAAYHAERSGADRMVNLATGAWLRGDFARALAQFEEAERRNDTEYYKARALRRLQAEARTPAPAGAPSTRVVLQMVDGIGTMSPDGRWAANWSEGLIWVRDMQSGRIVNWFEAAGNSLYGFGRDSRSVLVSDGGHLWRVYEIPTGRLRGTVPLTSFHPRTSKDGRRVAQFNEGSIVVHDVQSGLLMQQVPLPFDDYNTIGSGFDWSEDGRLVAMASRTPTAHSVVVLDLSTAKVLYDFDDQHPFLRRYQVNGWAHAVRFSPDSSQLAFSIEGQNSVFMLDLESGNLRAGKSRFAPRNLWFSPEGRRLGWIDRHRRVHVVSTEDLSLQTSFAGVDGWDLFFSNDGQYVFSREKYALADGSVVDDYLSPSIDGRFPRLNQGRLQLIDWKSRRSLSWDLAHGHALQSASLPEDIDDRLLDPYRNMWSRVRLGPLWTAGPRSIVYKPTGQDALVEVSRDTGRTLRSLPWLSGRTLWALRIDPTGRRLVAVYVEGLGAREQTAWASQRDNLTVYLDLIDLESGERTSTVETQLADHRGRSESHLKLSLGLCALDRFAFSPDGSKFVATFEWSRRQRPRRYTRDVQVRDAVTGRVLNEKNHSERVTAIAFSDDAMKLALGGVNGTVDLYDLGTGFLPTRVGVVTVSENKWVTALRALGDEWLIAHGRTVERWRIETDERVARMKGHMASIEHLFVLDEPKRMVTIAGEEVSVWTLDDPRRLATLMAMSDGGWLSFTPDGWYHASLEADQELYWARGDDLIPFDVFEQSLRAPRAVYETLVFGQVEQRPAVKIRDVVALPRPRLRVLAPEDGAMTTAPNATLRIRLEPADEPIEKVVVRQDGMVVAGVKLTKERAAADAPFEIEIPVDLVSGENALSVSALTRSARSDIARLSIRSSLDHRPKKGPAGRLRFVGIGISDHQDDRFDLKWAARDAKMLAQALAPATAELYLEGAQTDVVIDEQARRDAILDRVQAAADACEPNDTLVVFFAGHGVNWRNQLFFMAHDSDGARPNASAVLWLQLHLAIQNNGCRRTLVLLDSCHAGGYYNEDEAARRIQVVAEPTIDPHVNELARGAGIRVLAASQGNQLSVESSEWKHGAFTFAILEALKDVSADVDKDGALSVLELELFVRGRVKALTADRQTPIGKSEGTFRDYPLVKVARSE